MLSSILGKVKQCFKGRTENFDRNVYFFARSRALGPGRSLMAAWASVVVAETPMLNGAFALELEIERAVFILTEFKLASASISEIGFTNPELKTTEAALGV